MKFDVDAMALQSFIAATFAEFYGVAYRTPDGQHAVVSNVLPIPGGLELRLALTLGPNIEGVIDDPVPVRPVRSVDQDDDADFD